MKRIAVTVTLFVSWWISYAALAADTYQIDPAHTSVGFTVSHLVISEVSGRFNDVAGSVTYDPDKKAVTGAEATIQAKSIDTKIAKRDDHLRSPDFFDVEKYPTITFEATKVETDGGKTIMVGKFTMHGVTKEIRLPFTLKGPIKNPMGPGTRLGVSAETTLDRKDYGLTWNKALETGGVMVGEDVKISISAEAVKK
ncbi:MAG TPA: YceI family protein [Verrucomicrobiae bacterium]|nr:YceI family protein [Verrucomicrobiae bacterium]